MSAKKKKELYGLDLKPADYPFHFHLLDSPSFSRLFPEAANKKGKGRTTKLSDTKIIDKWLFVYNERDYNDAEKLWNNLYKASEAFGLTIEEPT